MVLRTMLMHARAYPTIFYTLDYRSVSIHFSSPVTVRCKKPFLFCRWSSSSHVTKRRSTSLGFNSYSTQVLASGSFLTLLNVLKQLTDQLVMFFQVLLASEIGFHRVFHLTIPRDSVPWKSMTNGSNSLYSLIEATASTLWNILVVI